MLYRVTAYPYVTQTGNIEVPDDVTDVQAYINEHLCDIDYETIDMDYLGTDFEYEKDNEED